jgi:hypothetical protein
MVKAARPTKRKQTEQMDFISPEEEWVIFGEQAREVLGMSGEEFAAQWAAGTFPDPDRPAIISVAMLLPRAW